VLDRFDGFLLTLPAVYYLTLILSPGPRDRFGRTRRVHRFYRSPNR